MTDLTADAALAADLVREAGALANELRGPDLVAEEKTSVSDLVTAADRAAERLVTDHLAAWRPDDGVIGEEGASRTSTSGRTWVIDPVDGTYNFVQGLTWWCSAVALVADDDVLLGAVYHPHEDALYVGGPGLPSTRNGELLHPMTDVALADACLTTYLHPPLYGGPVGEVFGRMVGRAATLRMLGSGTLDSMAVAQGQAHVRCQHSVAAWDWLPGAAIIRGAGGAARRTEAGGVVWSVAGAPTAVDEVCAALADR
ncbi:inositol monophosphatase family protein [Nocardioides terrisoli]|uniref:inositol monophosphatase family protein n=1 Tax=Nocardioides terrisoli TaxID=3388267 RepID=UPI00287B6553|nr:inositol monophosphatase [Nocardioides marmorisolisilvae]